MQANKSTSNRFHLRFYVSLSPSLRLSLSLSLFLYLPSFFSCSMKTTRPAKRETQCKHNEPLIWASQRDQERGRRRGRGEGRHVWLGQVHLNNCPPPAHISLIICQLRNQIISQSFAKSLGKQIVLPLQNVFVFGPAHCLHQLPHSSPHPCYRSTCCLWKIYAIITKHSWHEQVRKRVRERERETEVPILLAVTLPNKLFVRLSRTHINWIGPKNFLF